MSPSDENSRNISPGAATAASGRLTSLDGMRAVAISLVMFTHIATATMWGHYFAAIGVFGMGFRIFFIISGFLITHILLREFDRSGRISLSRFYFRRALRLLPAFWLFLTVMYCAARIGMIHLQPGDLICAGTFTMNYHYHRSVWLGHLWSLAVEEQFYLLWPLVLSYGGRRTATWVAGGTMIVAPLVRVVILSYSHSYGIASESFPGVADMLATGALLSLLRNRLSESPLYMKVITWRFFPLLPLVALVLNGYRGGRVHAGLLDTVVSVLLALTIDRLVRLAESSLSGRVLNSRAMVQFGALSYSLYLWQQPLLAGMEHKSLHSLILGLAALGTLAWISYQCIEVPARDFRRHLESGYRMLIGGPVCEKS